MHLPQPDYINYYNDEWGNWNLFLICRRKSAWIKARMNMNFHELIFISSCRNDTLFLKFTRKNADM